jgi:imidazolonepropionase-like amidohydrolase
VPRCALTNCTLIDGQADRALPGATVVLDGAHIAEVGTNVTLRPDVETIDLRGRTVMPGLMDAHVHLTMDTLCGQNIIWHHLANHPTLKAYHSLANAQKALDAGFTTLRNMQCGGADMAGDVALREAIDAGIIIGPRVLPSAMIFGMTGGHNDMFVPAIFKERWATAGR